MLRRILLGLMTAIAGALLVLSLLGIGAAWGYNEPATRLAEARLHDLDVELASAQLALEGARTELQRALRILGSARTTLEALARSTSQAQRTLEAVGDALDEAVIPSLRNTSAQLDQVGSALQAALATLETVNSLAILPVRIPGEEWLAGLLEATESLNAEIVSVEELAGSASTFLADVGYVLGGDFEETERGLERLLLTVTEYQTRIESWRAWIATARAELPASIDRVSVVLTVVLLWFGLSQAGLILHGVAGYTGASALREPQTTEARSDT